LNILADYRQYSESEQVFTGHAFRRAGAGQQLAVKPLHASSVAPGTELGMTARMGGIERSPKEQSPSRRADFHGLEHLLGLAAIGRSVYRGTHSFDEMLMRAAEHDELLGLMLERRRNALGNGWSPRGQVETLLAEHGEPFISKQ
jgi:hypothetical protein